MGALKHRAEWQLSECCQCGVVALTQACICRPCYAAAQVFTVRGQASGVSARTTRLRPVFLAW